MPSLKFCKNFCEGSLEADFGPTPPPPPPPSRSPGVPRSWRSLQRVARLGIEAGRTLKTLRKAHISASTLASAVPVAGYVRFGYACRFTLESGYVQCN